MNIEKKNRDLTVSTFIFYIVILLWITILKCNIETAVHGARIFLGPMTVYERFVYATSYFELDESRLTIILNVIIFIPFGILIPALRNKTSTLTTTTLAFITTFVIESLQLILTFGYFTYMDIICNTAGAFLGIILFACFIQRLRDEAKLKALTFLNGLAIAVSIFAIISTALNIEIYL